MKYSDIIRVALSIVFTGALLAVILWYLPVHSERYGLWVKIPLFLLYATAMVVAVALILKRFLLRQFTILFRLIEGGKFTGKELSVLSGEQDTLSDIRNKMAEWSRSKAMEIDHLKQMEKYRKEYLGNVSHELKTPIFNIQGYILTLLDGGMDDKTVNRLYLERSEKSINRMIQIVEDLESISRLESGELQLEYEPFDMLRLVEEVFELEEMTAKAAKIELQVEEKHAWVYADRKRIMEVMNNLIANTIKYGRKNGTTRVSFLEKDNLWWISVADNGIGIDDKDRTRIFERFYRCDKSRSREQGGTGLGLAIVKHIVEAHRQSITVQSELKKGSTFTFSLAKKSHNN
ncbi:MAG: sensor histidine kinase [Bacteroidales bacterium]|jgi:two-component system phosphate regulon sensor histidine kinase PhoR|nr:sensor histidine kinase [Bacteroidales bacterium]